MAGHLLKDPPHFIECDGRGFDDDCLLELGPLAEAACESGRLRIRITRHGGLATVSGASIRIDAVAGNIQIALGGHQTVVEFRPNASGAYDLRLWRSSKVVIGAKTTSNGVRIVCDDSEFECGEDCMFSDTILVQSADQHGIVDVHTGQIVNIGRRAVRLGDHVWLGRGSTIMPDVVIGHGAVIGTGALVTRSIDPMSIAVGIPAKTVKEGFTWCRSPTNLDPGTQQFIESWVAR